MTDQVTISRELLEFIAEPAAHSLTELSGKLQELRAALAAPAQEPVAIVDKHVPSAEIQWTDHGAELCLPHGTELFVHPAHPAPADTQFKEDADKFEQAMAEQLAAHQAEIVSLTTRLKNSDDVINQIKKVIAVLAKNVPDDPAPADMRLVEAAAAALAEIESVMQEAYNSATPVCCGRSGLECCGDSMPEWSEFDQRTMDRFAPHQRALNAALAAHKGEPT